MPEPIKNVTVEYPLTKRANCSGSVTFYNDKLYNIDIRDKEDDSYSSKSNRFHVKFYLGTYTSDQAIKGQIDALEQFQIMVTEALILARTETENPTGDTEVRQNFLQKLFKSRSR